MSSILHHQLPSFSYESSLFQKKLGDLLCKYVPRRFKRLVFLTSVYGMIEGVDIPDAEHLKRMNELLHLARDSKALALPILLQSKIWKSRLAFPVIRLSEREICIGDLKTSMLCTRDYDYLAAYLIEKAPRCLNYGSLALVARDLERLFMVRTLAKKVKPAVSA